MNKKYIIPILIIVAFSLFVVAVAPVLNTARIGESLAYTDTDLTGYCNASDAENDSLSYYGKWINGSSEYSSVNLLYYIEEEQDADSYSSVSDFNLILFNYTKPYNALNSSKLFVKHGNIDAYNVTIPSSCWAESVLQFRGQGGRYTGSSFDCYNGSVWVDIGQNIVYDGSCDLFCDNSPSGLVSNFYDNDLNSYTVYITGCAANGWSSSFVCSESKIYEESMYWHIGYNSSTEYLIDTLDSSATKKDEVWTFSCLANDGLLNSSWVNSTPITISNTFPVFTEINISTTISHNTSIASQLNATDLDGDTIKFTINDTNFDINSSGYMNKTNSLSTVGTYNVSVTINDTDNITIGWVYYDITNTAPLVSDLNIVPNDPRDNSNLTFTNTTIEPDGDIITDNEVLWYKNNVLQSNLTNLTNVESGNLTLDDTWIVGFLVYDGLVWSEQVNSTEVTISDQSAPTIISTSPSVATQDTQFTIEVRFSDDKNVTAVNITLKDPDDIIVLASQPMVYQGSIVNNDTTKNTTYQKTYTPVKSGTYTATVVTATDEDGNTLTAIDEFTVIVSAVEVSAGGGGSDTVIIIGGVNVSLEISPENERITTSPGRMIIKDIFLENTGDTSVNVGISIVQDGESFSWIKLGESSDISSISLELPAAGGLDLNKKFIKYTVTVPPSVDDGTYISEILFKSGDFEQVFEIKIIVGDSIFSQILSVLDSSIFEINKEICIDETAIDVCEKTKIINFKFKWLYIVYAFIPLFVLIFINIFNNQARKLRRKKN